MTRIVSSLEQRHRLCSTSNSYAATSARWPATMNELTDILAFPTSSEALRPEDEMAFQSTVACLTQRRPGNTS